MIDDCVCGHAKSQHSIVMYCCKGRDSYGVRCTCVAFRRAKSEDHYETEPAHVEDGWRARPKPGDLGGSWVDEHWDGTL
jgi:hypothetical protein